MRYWSFRDGFGLENLVACEGEASQPGPDEVLLELSMASLNYRDLVVMRGQHGKAVTTPLIPLSDGVGKIIETGSAVRDFSVGDRVSPAFFQHWEGGAPPQSLESGRLGGPLDGVLTSHGVFPARALVRVPEYLTDAEAATLPCAGVTAWSALSEPAPVRPGETVLILGTGGVALLAISLAKAAGARVIVTTSSAERAAQVRKLGADLAIDRNEVPNWSKMVREVTGGAGCDRVVELGGAATLMESVKAAKTGGTIIVVGNVTGNTAEVFLPLLLTRRLTLHSVSVGSRQAFVALNRALDHHRIRPVVDTVFPFDQAPDAFRVLERGGGFGNACISCAQEAGR